VSTGLLLVAVLLRVLQRLPLSRFFTRLRVIAFPTGQSNGANSLGAVQLAHLAQLVHLAQLKERESSVFLCLRHVDQVSQFVTVQGLSGQLVQPGGEFPCPSWLSWE